MTKNKNFCVRCGKKIYKNSIRCHSCALKKYHKINDIHGKNNPNWKKRIEKACIICSNKFTVLPSHNKDTCSFECWQKYRTECSRISRKGKTIIVKCDYCNKLKKRLYCETKYSKLHFCNNICKSLWLSENMCGENSILWRGGYNNYNTYGLNWHRQRKLALFRDENICQVCGITSEELKLNMDVHHIIPFRLFESYINANDLENLICLCRTCHSHEDNLFRKEENIKKE